MLRVSRLLASVLLVPVLGAIIATVLRSHADASFALELRHSLTPGDPLRHGPQTLTELCSGTDADTYQACNADVGYRLFAGASLVAGAGGLLLVAGIALAGAVARVDRRVLLALFRPGLYVAATVVTGLIAIHAVLATVVLYAGVQAVLPGTPMFFGGVIRVGALAGIRVVPQALFGALREHGAFAFGGRATRQQAPELWHHVESVATALGALPPDEIVLALDTAFFVTEVSLQTPNGISRGRTLSCSLPLMRILTIDEFTAVVAHELGHFRGEDTAFSRHFYPIYARTSAAISALAASGRGSRSIALLPAIAIFEFFLNRFAIADRGHSRRRELVADAAGAEMTSARALATALVKAHAFAPLLDKAFEQAATAELGEGRPVPHISVIFAAEAARAAMPAVFDGILDTHTSHPTDTHPPLAVRLDALGLALKDLATDALRVVPAEPATTLATVGDLHDEALSLILVTSSRRPAGGQPRRDAP